jgi:L-ascorbate metabolism protein UlaG (beta-lactamase superfamily)
MNQDSAFLKITYVGHATVLLEMDGVRLLTDPLLRDWVFHLKRQSPKVAASLYQDIDAVLISHLHWDHFDIASMKLLDRNVRVLMPLGAAGLLERYGFRNVQEMQPGDTAQVGALAVRATYAQHEGRVLRRGPSSMCLGYLVEASRVVYFPGDTDLFQGMAELSADLDLVLLPVWGWGPNLGPGHMDPRRAAEALTLLRPRIAIPIHWGTFYPRWMGWLRPYLLSQPPQNFRQEAIRLMPQVEVHILAPGGSFLIPVA